MAPSFTLPPELALVLFVAPILLDAAYDASLRDLHDDDPVGRELRAARERALRAGRASFAHDESPAADAGRQEFTTHLTDQPGDTTGFAHGELHRGALRAARQAVLAMRANDEIGDDAFHQIEEELDWLDMAGGSKGQ